jgi:AcrR family transcriptional regulator
MAAEKPAPKRKKDREATMALISNAALSIFSKVGFDKATTKAIAVKAGVAEALIIRYFGTKKGLLISLTKDYIIEIEKEPVLYAAQETIEDELEYFVSFGLKNMLGFEKIFKVVHTHSLLDEGFAKDLKAALPEKRMNPVILERFDDFRKSGQISENFTNEQIYHDLKFHMLGHFLLSKPILGISSADSRENMVKSVRIYATGLRTR